MSKIDPVVLAEQITALLLNTDPKFLTHKDPARNGADYEAVANTLVYLLSKYTCVIGVHLIALGNTSNALAELTENVHENLETEMNYQLQQALQIADKDYKESMN